MVHDTWDYSDNTPEINYLAAKMKSNSTIDTSLYGKFDVKRGLRDIDGKGVLTGLTDISTIKQNKLVDGKLVPCEGELYYRGYTARAVQDASAELLPRRHSQGAERGHDELHRAFRADAFLL